MGLGSTDRAVADAEEAVRRRVEEAVGDRSAVDDGEASMAAEGELMEVEEMEGRRGNNTDPATAEEESAGVAGAEAALEGTAAAEGVVGTGAEVSSL